MDGQPHVQSEPDTALSGTVLAVQLSLGHKFSKDTVDAIDVVAGQGVAGDAHAGATVQHLSRLKRDRLVPNLRQVHLIQAELFDELAADGFTVHPGDLGENITTSGLNLLALPTGASLRIGDVVLTLTGLRNPCVQINGFASGLMKRLAPRENGETRYVAGVMTTVAFGGSVSAGHAIQVVLPRGPQRPLERV